MLVDWVLPQPDPQSGWRINSFNKSWAKTGVNSLAIIFSPQYIYWSSLILRPKLGTIFRPNWGQQKSFELPPCTLSLAIKHSQTYLCRVERTEECMQEKDSLHVEVYAYDKTKVFGAIFGAIFLGLLNQDWKRSTGKGLSRHYCERLSVPFSVPFSVRFSVPFSV